MATPLFKAFLRVVLVVVVGAGHAIAMAASSAYEIRFDSGALPLPYDVNPLATGEVVIEVPNSATYKVITSLPYRTQAGKPGNTQIVLLRPGAPGIIADSAQGTIEVGVSQARSPQLGAAATPKPRISEAEFNETVGSATANAPAATAQAATAPVATILAQPKPTPSEFEKAAATPAAQQTAADAANVISKYSVDLSIPDSPGLAIVGLSTEDVVNPDTPRALAAAIHNGVASDGKVKTGVAIDFAPFKVFQPQTSKQSYVDSRIVRALWNTSVSVGTAKPMDATDKSLRAGVGVSSIVFRRASSDPVMNLTHFKCVQDSIRADLKDATPGAIGVRGEKEDKASAKPCYDKLAAESWNATAIHVGLATSRYSPTGAWGDGKLAAHGGWLSGAYGFEDFGAGSGWSTHAQATATVRRLLKEQVADPLDDSKTVEQGSWLVGGKLRWRGDDRNYFMEYSYRRIEIADRPTDNVRKLAVGLEWKLADSVWLVAALGGEGGRSQGKDNSFVTTGIKFGSSSESLLGK
jgi:hypothetical protein